ncbi:MAG TPA: prolyl oligopeptidase family serine peptidase, partial [Verrucomicrobiae bacterium]
LISSNDGKWILAQVANGDGGDYAFYLKGAKGPWRQIAQFADQVKAGSFGRDGYLYLRTLAGAPRGKIIRVPLKHPELSRAELMVPESEAVIESILPTAHGLYVQDLVGGPSQIRYFDRPAGTPKVVPLPPVASALEIVCLAGDKLLFNSLTYISPYAWQSYDPATGQVTPTPLAGVAPAKFDDLEVVREFATSKDGTKVPLNIVRRKGLKLDGHNPTLLYAYGGYGISMKPRFSLANRVWFDQGGVYVVANIRGGGEYGEAWHKAGNLTRKQNVFDDFAACAQYLVKQGYTRPEKLAVQGGSNGGLLMGAFLTQHPEYAHTVISSVGIYDSLRSELEPNGAFNITEFGTVKDPDQFAALYAYSPYHHVVTGTKYPAILMLTGDHDGRVNPYHSRKMIARLQAANASENPILLRTTSAAGHGMGTSLDERIAQESDVFAFLLATLGMEYRE